MRLALLLLVAAPLAGCLSEAPAPAAEPPHHVLGALRPSELSAGHFYTFHHGGGDLEFAIHGDPAIFDLYDPDDRRLGQFLVEEGRSTVVFRGVPVGDPVLVASQLNGTLGVVSGGRAVVSFTELGLHRERLELANQGNGITAVPPLPGGLPNFFGTPINNETNQTLVRAPYALDVLGQGTSDGLHVRLSTDKGPVFEAQRDIAGGASAISPAPLVSMGGDFYPQNVRNGTLLTRIQANQFDGVLLLSATSFSRAQPARADNASLQQARFPLANSYSGLVDRPSILHVHEDARKLGFSMSPSTATGPPLTRALAAQLSRGLLVADDAPDPTFAGVVVVWAPNDTKLATLPVPINGTVILPITHGGDYVAWSAVGKIEAYADVPPRDFQPVPLDIQAVDVAVPQTNIPLFGLGGAGASGYQAFDEPVPENGIYFQVAAFEAPGSILPGPPLFGCQPSRLVRLVQGGEDLGVWGGEQDATTDVLNATLRLGDGPLTATYDSFGDDGCTQEALRLTYYVRQPG